MADGPLISGTVDFPAQAQAMRANGVGSVRVAVSWAAAQPAAGGPLDLRGLDAVVAGTAAHGITVLPVVLWSPRWARANPAKAGSPPRNPADYAAFLTALVRRYGPQGSFWAEHPELAPLPIARWQVWNEPDITKYWDGRRWATGYVRLLRAARAAIKAADPSAQVVLAGLTNRSWEDLDRVYAAGGRTAFDVAAIHPFSRRVANVVKIVRLARGTMKRRGDARKPLLLSEISWSSGRGHSRFNYGWETTEKGQAQRVRDVLGSLAKRRVAYRLAGVYWYTWLSPRIGGADSFDYSGLRRQTSTGAIVDKPALGAWRATVARLTAAGR